MDYGNSFPSDFRPVRAPCTEGRISTKPCSHSETLREYSGKIGFLFGTATLAPPDSGVAAHPTPVCPFRSSNSRIRRSACATSMSARCRAACASDSRFQRSRHWSGPLGKDRCGKQDYDFHNRTAPPANHSTVGQGVCGWAWIEAAGAPFFANDIDEKKAEGTPRPTTARDRAVVVRGAKRAAVERKSSRAF